jgi:hypothetical protein
MFPTSDADYVAIRRITAWDYALARYAAYMVIVIIIIIAIHA